jgi:fumarate hydratase subunit beta
MIRIYGNTKKLYTPLNNNQITQLTAGDLVEISGYIYTARDSANQKFFELLKNQKKLPIKLEGQIIFYAGPTPAKPGYQCGSIGPTSSYRMDPYTPLLLENGLKGMIGKGSRSREVIESMIKNKAVYFVVIGGTAALIAKNVKQCEEIEFKDLDGEIIYKLYMDNLIAIVAIDTHGNNIYNTEPQKYNRNK